MRKTCYLYATIWCFVLGLSVSAASVPAKKLVIWSHWGKEPVKVSFMKTVTREFSKTHNIPVEIVWIPKNELLEKLPFALDSSEPDIVYLDSGFSHPRIVRSLQDLSGLQLSGQISPSWELQDLGNGSRTFLPIEGISHAIYYNKLLFQQAGIEVPGDRLMTASEFLDIVGKLRAEGITPIGEGAGDRAIKASIPIMNTLFRYMGPEKLSRLLTGAINFSDPDAVAALNFWQHVIDAKGYDPSKALQLTLSEGIFEVTDGKAAMNFCGTYFYSKYGATERDKGQIGVLDWFTVKNGKGNKYYEILWEAGFGINKHSAHLEDAKAFLEYLMTPEAASLWMERVQTPYPVIAQKISAESLCGKLTEQRKHQTPSSVLFTYESFAEEAAQRMWEDVTRKFIVGTCTVEQFIERMNSRL